jgi:subtilisin-like proprotein convertase family protein
MNINNSFLFENDANLNIVLNTNAFYGETSSGEWFIKVVDGKSGDIGTLNSWDINILGH